MELLEVGGGPGLQPGVVGVGRVLLVLQLPLDLVPHLVLPLQGEGHQLVPEHTQGHVQDLFLNVFNWGNIFPHFRYWYILKTTATVIINNQITIIFLAIKKHFSLLDYRRCFINIFSCKDDLRIFLLDHIIKKIIHHFSNASCHSSFRDT